MEKGDYTEPITLTVPKEQDFAPRPPIEHHDSDSDSHSDGNTTATNSSDEFDWEEDDDRKEEKEVEKKRAKRGRAIYLALMKLSRPVRVFLIGALGAGILVTPLLVFNLRFKNSPARQQAHIWSLWLTIIWSAGCVTYLVVDSLPRLIISIIVLFGGQVERLKLQIEVR
jgi:hypothetical protein